MNDLKFIMLGKIKINGYSVCPSWLLLKYREAANYTCKQCLKNESEVGKLQPHRITRGVVGGIYTVWPINKKGSNIIMLCDKCHKRIHENEIKKVSHSY